MLYKPGKSHAKGTNGGLVSKAAPSPPPSTSLKQHHHMWYRLGHFLSSIGQIGLFGSHHNLTSVGDGAGSQVKEDQQPQQRNFNQQKQHRHRQHLKHGNHFNRPRCRPNVAVSCQDLARASATLNSDNVGLTFSDDEEGQPDVNRVAKWATGLVHLLADPNGVGVFAEFLRGEFSEENITFWLSVEEFKRLEEPDKLLAAARHIARAHIGCDAPASINLDGATVHDLESRLRQGQPPPDPRLFNAAQEHIFNLMRLDSYARFLKSSLYKDCLLCELESQPLPTPPVGSSLRCSQDSLGPASNCRLQVGDNGRKLSRDLFLVADLDPSSRVGQLQHQRRQQQPPDPSCRRSRQPSFIVAALDLDCGFSVC